MGRNDAKSQPNGPVTMVQVPVPNPLALDSNPTLGADLQASGHDIVGAGDIQAKTFNGKTILQSIEAFFAGVKKEIESYAKKDHTHPEISALSKSIDGKADKDHTHELQDHSHNIKDISGTITLDRVEGGDKIASLIVMDLCPAQHTHPNIEKAIATLDANVKLVAKAVDTKVSPEAITGLTKSINALEDVLRDELKALEKKIPVLPKAERNIIGIKRVHVPYSGIVQEIVGRDENGSHTKVTVTRSGKDVLVGDTLAADDILALSPASASVRIRVI